MLPERVADNQPQAEEIKDDVKPQILLPEHIENNQQKVEETGLVPVIAEGQSRTNDVMFQQQVAQQEAMFQQQVAQQQAMFEQTAQQNQTGLVPVTPAIENKLVAFSQNSVAALEKSDPQKAQQATKLLESTNGVANRLQIAGNVANEAKGNDVKAAQQQHNKETALVLAARNNNNTK